MKLIHLTNYWGEYINSGTDHSGEVPFDAIWAQVVQVNSHPCCPGFGERSVRVENRDFEDEHNEWWSVFLVSGEHGRNCGHYFYKFVCIPQGTYDFGKRGCASRGWKFVGEFLAQSALEDLHDILYDWMFMDDGDFNHVHVGIMMDQLYAG